MKSKDTLLISDPQWYKDAIIYELHIKTFCDGNDDGMGDFKGLSTKLDYLESLGVNAVWLLPFYPSPLRDDGYDIADYRSIHTDYGNMGDFRTFLREAHARNIRVITELVINHTSDQHAWFQRARKAKPGSVSRNYYMWTNDPHTFSDARIIFQDFEHSNWSWDPVANAYYWHRFYHHQPDLNYDSPHVQKAVLKILDYWFKMGVDGLRLDAIPYLFAREGTNCENLQETFDFLKQLRAHIDANHDDKMLLAEANQWPEDAVEYFGEGDSCHMAFHFPLMPRMFMSIEMEDRHPILDILDQTPEIPDNCQWALFLRNHDELTLEMVSDEERDYMHRAYAKDPKARINLGIRRRLAPLLGNDRKKIELMNVLLFSFPGTPVIYYGDEIGMGDNYYLGDRDGVRTPMQWSGDRNAGFSRANPQKLYLPVIIDPDYHYNAVNVEGQERNPSSLLWWMRRLIAMRKNHKSFGRGDMTFLYPDNPKILAFTRKTEDESILIVANLSRHSQPVELDLKEFEGFVPEELFSRNRFLPISDKPYVLTLSSYGYYMFVLHAPEQTFEEVTAELPSFKSTTGWDQLFDNKFVRRRFEEDILSPYLKKQRWFGGKAKIIQDVTIKEWLKISRREGTPTILLVKVRYTEGPADMYVLPLDFMLTENFGSEPPEGAVTLADIREGRGVIYDAVFNEQFCLELFQTIKARKKLSAHTGKIMATSGSFLRRLLKQKNLSLEPKVLRAEQSNTSILFGNAFILKMYRRTEEGVHPDAEIVRFLTEEAKFDHIPPFAGSLEFKRPKRDPVVMGLMQEFIPNQGDAWTYSLDAVRRFYDRVLTGETSKKSMPVVPDDLLSCSQTDLEECVIDHIGGLYSEMAILLGRRTAEMHLALASNHENPKFRPESFSLLYQRSVYQSMQSLTKQELRLLRKILHKLPEKVLPAAREILGMEKQILDQLRSILKKKISAMKTRLHGDYHLGQVLYTGKDFVIFDFEGEPARAMSERRLKRSPIRDVAGMIRSFHYAAHTVLLKHMTLPEKEILALEPWADLWYRAISGLFLRGYLETAHNAPFIPKEREELHDILSAFMLEKAVYELGYEMNNRPEWIIIPIRGIKHLCGAQHDQSQDEKE